MSASSSRHHQIGLSQKTWDCAADKLAGGVQKQVRIMNEHPRRFVYVLRSVTRPDRHYVGLTSDIAAGLASHNAGESPSTSRHKPWRVVVLVQFAEEQRAVEFEKFLKSGSGRAFARQHFA
jgi:putative endonuclease